MTMLLMLSTKGVVNSAPSSYHFHRIPTSCGVIKTEPFGPLPKWQSTNLTYALLDIPYAQLGLSSAAVRFSIAAAFDSWAAVTPFHFVEAQNSDQANIKISFATGDHGDGEPFDGPGGLLAHSFAPPSGIMHFDAEEYWRVDGFEEPSYFLWVDLQSIALHEIGHIIGLGHAQNSDAVMYRFISVREVKRELTVHDVQCAAALYATPLEVPYIFVKLLFALICTSFICTILFSTV
ncbi:metalloendoproteinase 1-MMP isoform X2 [Cryptomeria japonica]|nr:metalloendoproteinase 1-MMP isoform X2 [Cryptomeria japonica]